MANLTLDESKFRIFCSNHEEIGTATTRVWGYISLSGVGDLVKIDETMNAEKYCEILIHNVVSSGKHLISKGFFSV